MVNTRTKKINGKEYLYAERSFRLPDGKTKKISKIIKRESEANSKKTNDYFSQKTILEYQKYALNKYRAGHIITKDEIIKIEEMKVKYKELMRKLTKKQISDILDRFTANFTYESNAIEGNSLTLKDVTLIMSERIVPEGKDLREVYETKNTREANELLFNKKIIISIKGIIKLHEVLIKDTGVSTGLKKIPNYLVLRDLKTTPPESVLRELEKLLSWYHDNKESLHPLELVSNFHARFEEIHPFEDGNGRVGRMLINAMLLESGYPPLIIRKSSRIAYFSALEDYDNGHHDKLLRFLVRKFKDTFKKFFEVYVNYL